MLVSCTPQRTPEDVRSELLRKLPVSLADRGGWARDIQAAFASQDLEATSENLCAVLAVVEQESTYHVDPQVSGLAGIARREIDRRAASMHVPRVLVETALKFRSPDGRTFDQRISALRTEQELSALFEEMAARVPMGQRLFGRFNPVRTGGPMQVRINFAAKHARGYPYPIDGSIRREVFSRRGGLYFGIKHLLDYPVDYPAMRYRFADFNAGWYASRNAAFQRAAGIATGIRLAGDGDLLKPGAPMELPGATERALRSIGGRLGMDEAAIRADLQRGDDAAFAGTGLYTQVFAIADAKGSGQPVPRASMPQIELESPKISRNLTTAWFADRVESRWKACLAR
ncbi:MAG: DUF1615 domain-containing protein [Pseudomonadota bacterium]|nr:DUF1615 domain-containing protein [Pseudomonadota bacterium]